MSEVWYEIVNDKGERLTDIGGSVYDHEFMSYQDGILQSLHRYDSRTEAETLRGIHGGTIHRHTVTTDVVGLEWVPPVLADSINQPWKLLDGTKQVAGCWLRDTGKWRSFNDWTLGEDWDTLDEAKAAAERSVKERWT